MPKISVIVPVYNMEKYLQRCVDSLLKQTFYDIEVILVDDGSKDNTPRMCDEFAQKYSKIRTVHKENGGLVTTISACFNSSIHSGLLKSPSPFKCFIPISSGFGTRPPVLLPVYSR